MSKKLPPVIVVRFLDDHMQWPTLMTTVYSREPFNRQELEATGGSSYIRNATAYLWSLIELITRHWHKQRVPRVVAGILDGIFKRLLDESPETGYWRSYNVPPSSMLSDEGQPSDEGQVAPTEPVVMYVTGSTEHITPGADPPPNESSQVKLNEPILGHHGVNQFAVDLYFLLHSCKDVLPETAPEQFEAYVHDLTHRAEKQFNRQQDTMHGKHPEMALMSSEWLRSVAEASSSEWHKTSSVHNSLRSSFITTRGGVSFVD